jgi:hypothetical protein
MVEVRRSNTDLGSLSRMSLTLKMSRPKSSAGGGLSETGRTGGREAKSILIAQRGAAADMWTPSGEKMAFRSLCRPQKLQTICLDHWSNFP